MTTPAADYDAAVTAFRTQKLPAYVEYTQEGSARGIAGWHGVPERIVVDVRSKKIVSVSPKNDSWDGVESDSPVTKMLFDPACYEARGERSTQWNGHDAIAIAVRHTANSCKDDMGLNTVYADAKTFELLGADASDTDDGMSVDISVQYAKVGDYIVPTAISAHAHGHGWLFWARERAEVRFINYAFTNERRQLSSP